MAHQNGVPIKRTIRRQQLREMVPLADSTIYEMEQRGEFPRRFALSPRCVVWDLAEVEAWLAVAPVSTQSPARQSPDVRQRRIAPGSRAGSGSSSGIEGGMSVGTRFLPGDPGVDDVRPLLHHVATLHFVLGLVVDAAR